MKKGIDATRSKLALAQNVDIDNSHKAVRIAGNSVKLVQEMEEMK